MDINWIIWRLNFIQILISLVLGDNNYTVKVAVTKNCPTIFVNIDEHENTYIKSAPVGYLEYHHREECSVSMITGMVDHGICVSVFDVNMSNDVEILFQTNTYEPDKKIDKNHARPSEWCTPEALMTITVRVKHSSRNAPDGPLVNFSMKIQAVPLDHIQQKYYMDSKLACGVQHKIKQGDSVHLFSHRRPRVSKELPSSCEVTFISTGTGEYEQVCMRFDKLMSNCGMSLVASNLLEPYWPSNETFNCMSEMNEKDEFCSDNKELKLQLNRLHTTNSDFAITIEGKKHTYWKTASSIKNELIGVDVVRTLIYLVSIINATVAVSVAVISFLNRNPLSSFRQWSIHSVFYFPKSCPGTILNTTCTPNDQDHIQESFTAEKMACEEPVI